MSGHSVELREDEHGCYGACTCGWTTRGTVARERPGPQAAPCPRCHQSIGLRVDGTLDAHRQPDDRPCPTLWPDEPGSRR